LQGKDESSTPFISVLVPTWNRAALLLDCLQALTVQDYPHDLFEIVVVDDGSTDHSDVVVRSLQGTSKPTVRYRRLEHRGVNAARNEGIMAARGEVVCFVDDDEVVMPDHLSRISCALREAPGVAGVGGPVREDDDKSCRLCSRCRDAARKAAGGERRIVRELPGGNMALRTSAIRAIGPFDEELSGAGDESEWFWRAHDLSFLHDPGIVARHRKDLVPFGLRCRVAFRQGRALPAYRRKTGTDPAPSSLRLAKLLGHALRRRCTRGLILGCREAGDMFQYLAAGGLTLLRQSSSR
jgi:glycosyltransferase involved in cell wall biosynthesis